MQESSSHALSKHVVDRSSVEYDSKGSQDLHSKAKSRRKPAQSKMDLHRSHSTSPNSTGRENSKGTNNKLSEVGIIGPQPLKSKKAEGRSSKSAPFADITNGFTSPQYNNNQRSKRHRDCSDQLPTRKPKRSSQPDLAMLPMTDKHFSFTGLLRQQQKQTGRKRVGSPQASRDNG
jgi:hypothetical protein